MADIYQGPTGVKGVRHENYIYNPVNYDPEEELFTAGMRDTEPQKAPSSLFEPLVAIFAPHSGNPINAVTCTVADLGEVEVMQV